jgi:hypothetical protein
MGKWKELLEGNIKELILKLYIMAVLMMCLWLVAGALDVIDSLDRLRELERLCSLGNYTTNVTVYFNGVEQEQAY